MSTPEQAKVAKENDKVTPNSGKPVGKAKKGGPSNLKQYQPRLMLDENEEEKTVLIKIGMRTSTRQIINFALGKVKNDWKVTLNAFQMDMTKALQACEIIKTRLPFLHQENKLQSYLATHKVEVKDTTTERKIIRTGIAITLCRNAFEVEDPAGYQKPKPRQFVQPLPRNSGRRHPKDRASSAPKEDLRKRKKSGGKKKGKRGHDFEAMGSSEEERKASRSEFKVWGGKKQDEDVVKSKKKNGGIEKKEKSPRDKKGRPHSGQRDPRDGRRSISGGRGGYHGPPGDPRYMRGMGYRRPSPGRFRHEEYYYRPGYPRDFSEEEYRFRGGPPRGGSRGVRGGFRGPIGRGGRPHFQDERGYGPRDDFERPERPGYYSGNRQFRMDKTRDQPIEKLHNRAANQIEKERYERIQQRDQRNRPNRD